MSDSDSPEARLAGILRRTAAPLEPAPAALSRLIGAS